MIITVKCQCGKPIQANADLAGQFVQCMNCRRNVVIPFPQKEAPPAIAPAEAVAKTPPSSQDYLHWLLLLALIPLFASPFLPDDEDPNTRFERAFKTNKGLEQRVNEALEENQENIESQGEVIDITLAEFPDNRLDSTALLPRKTFMHWVYAGVSAVGFFAIIYLLFPSLGLKRENLIWVGFFTGTIGIIFLLIAQQMAFSSMGSVLFLTSPLAIFVWIFRLIGWMYYLALMPEVDFGRSLVGFTFGVGLCEELVKALPLLWYYKRGYTIGWRGACLWGLASGAGFGVSEGIHYSAEYYNGITSAWMYVVRFASCVALHAIWTASVGLTLSTRYHFLQKEEDARTALIIDRPWSERLIGWFEMSLPVLGVLSIAVVLHGLYDAFLKKDMEIYALMTALVSFGWLVWQIESKREADPGAPGAATAPASA